MSADAHRHVSPDALACKSFPFSVFQFIQGDEYRDHDAIHRCFSLARMYGAKMFVEENICISRESFMYQDMEDFCAIQGDDSLDGTARRISFWQTDVSSCPDAEEQLNSLPDSDCLGYMILQKIGVHLKGWIGYQRRWIIYEAVLNGGDLQHGVIPRQSIFSFHVGSCKRIIRGRLYCQQNGVTTVCAHVAIRSLLASLSPERDVSYREINKYAREAGSLDFNNGLSVEQIRNVVHGLGFVFEDWSLVDGKMPNYHCLYSGVESGGGSLFGFVVTKDERREICPQHIIPLFGHSFNKHIWVNEATGLYFQKEADDIGAFTSDNWISTFIGHDDNVGPNIYIPRYYVERIAASYAMAILPKKLPALPACDSYAVGAKVEREAVDWLRCYVRPWLREWQYWAEKQDWRNSWLSRLLDAIPESSSIPANVVLHCLFVERDKYLSWLGNSEDWGGVRETPERIAEVKQRLPDNLWIVEFSVPHLFPANERKVGELVFDAEHMRRQSLKDDEPVSDAVRKERNKAFVMIRIPCRYIFPLLSDKDNNDECACTELPSVITSHMPCLVYPDTIRVG